MFENYFIEKYSKKLLLEITSSKYLSNYFSIENMSILFQISKIYSKCQKYFFILQMSGLYFNWLEYSFITKCRELFFCQMISVFLVEYRSIFRRLWVFCNWLQYFSIDTTAVRSIFQLTRELFSSWHEKLSSH